MRIINVARGPLVVDEDLKAALDDGKVAGAALDVFAQEPITDHPLFGYPNVVVTPHLGASTAEAQDRAGVQTAEQVVAALTGGVVSTAVNIPAVSAEDMEVLGPFIPLALRLGRIAAALAEGVERVEVEHMGRIAERDTRLLTLVGAQRRVRRPHRGGRQPRQRAGAGRGARDRRLRAPRDHRARLRRPDAGHARHGRGARARGRHDARPPAPPAPARGLGAALQPPDRRPAPGAVPLQRRAGDGRPRRLGASASTASTSRPPPSAARRTAPAATSR